ncbi:2-phospho-L-lactate transferase [Candidatus Thorarchaeota archaeon]|nr:MAG: 2-phospho-L-lactate transferase [Candidatus Thorarchaeota archaeon]
MKVTALSGGIGGSKLALGLYKALESKALTVVVNTGDDINIHGLQISPDIDIVMYTLSGVVDEEKGWGLKDDTFDCIGTLSTLYGYEEWFNLGDRDLATHLVRTSLLRAQKTPTEVTAYLAKRLGLSDVTILPMSDDRIETHVRLADTSWIHFEEYFVKRRCQGELKSIRYTGHADAEASPQVLSALRDSDVIILCPSNPVASIGPILSISGLRAALVDARCPVVAVTPLIGGKAVKGPTKEFMELLGLEVSPLGIIDYYSDFLDGFVLDQQDRGLESNLEERGLEVLVTNTMMRSLEDKVQLAKDILAWTKGLVDSH